MGLGSGRLKVGTGSLGLGTSRRADPFLSQKGLAALQGLLLGLQGWNRGRAKIGLGAAGYFLKLF